MEVLTPGRFPQHRRLPRYLARPALLAPLPRLGSAPELLGDSDGGNLGQRPSQAIPGGQVVGGRYKHTDTQQNIHWPQVPTGHHFSALHFLGAGTQSTSPLQRWRSPARTPEGTDRAAPLASGSTPGLPQAQRCGQLSELPPFPEWLGRNAEGTAQAQPGLNQVKPQLRARPSVLDPARVSSGLSTPSPRSA